MDNAEHLLLLMRVAETFTPSAPVDELNLFAGRKLQSRNVLNAVLQRGQHVILFGERGVGKTSLANVLFELLSKLDLKSMKCKTINCDQTMTYSSLWHAIFREMSFDKEISQIGFTGEPIKERESLDSLLPEQVTPDDVRHLLQQLPSRVLLIIDEVDRIKDQETTTLLADTIKALSDHSVPTTLILVGVADSVDELIAEHNSVERALVQVRMPRMSIEELVEIVDRGLATLNMSIEEEAKRRIVRLSQGLPHYTHLLALHATQDAINSRRTVVEKQDVKSAIERALDGAQQSVIKGYHRAISSPRQNLYKQILLACALAEPDYLGYFSSADVRTPMSAIMGKPYHIPAFSRHLNDFCSESRGPILQKTGTPRNFRFRFINPLLQPFVIMDGLANDLIPEGVARIVLG